MRHKTVAAAAAIAVLAGTAGLAGCTSESSGSSDADGPVHLLLGDRRLGHGGPVPVHR